MKTPHQASTAVFKVKKDAPRTRGDSTTKTLERLCVVATIAFLPFPSLFQLCCRASIAHVAADSPSWKLNPLLYRLTSSLSFFFILGRHNGGFSGQIIVMNMQK